MELKRFFKMGVIGSLFVIVGCKFHEVDPGRYYRSPQPKGDELREIHSKVGLQTIINLRGHNPGSEWYEEEVEFAKQNKIPLIDISMSAKTIPSRKNLLKLLDAFKAEARPMLVHCRAGVDRTGEASAIYAMLYMGQTKEQALELLSSKYGHVDGVSPKAKIYFIKELWQGEDWARNEYFPCKQKYEYFDRSHCDQNGEEIDIAIDPNED